MTTATTETDRNRAAVEEMYGAAKCGDIDKFFSFISADVTVEEPAFLPYGGTYEGLEGLQKLFGDLASKFDLSGLDFERFVADGEDFCVIGQIPLAAGADVVSFIERGVIRDGKVVHLRIYIYDPASLLEVR
jgi:hypothetical protein